MNIDSPDPRGCRNEEPFQTTLRGLASYTLPKIDVLVSGTVRSQPPVQITGQPARTGTCRTRWCSSLLGRLPPGGLATGNTTVQLLDNGDNRLYADNRRTQIDMRFAKILRFGRMRTDIGVDLYNLLNSNYATRLREQLQLHAAERRDLAEPDLDPVAAVRAAQFHRSTTDVGGASISICTPGPPDHAACSVWPTGRLSCRITACTVP